MNLDKTQLSLLDGVETSEFGYVRFLSVSDLLLIGEESYNKIMSVYSQNIECYENMPKNFKVFDLIFLKSEDGERMSFDDGQTLLDVLLYSIALIFEIEQNDIVVSEEKYCFYFKTNGKLVIIHRDNYDDLCDIVLKSNMREKFKLDEGIKFKEDTSDDKRKKFLEWLEYEEKKEIENANSISMMANIVMAKLKLYAQKDIIRKMTIYNLLFAYSSEMSIEGYNDTYKQYLAGADPKKLDMTHWSSKIKKIIKNKED